MATIEYSLFRAKFIHPHQTLLFAGKASPSQIFLTSINERPSTEIREGYTWHIGNIRSFTATTGYFAVGRTTSATVETFDDKTGNFVEEELETSPYTHVVYDAGIGVIAVARKNRLAPTTKAIASKIEALLGQTSTVMQNELTVEILPIRDPRGFIEEILAACRVATFTATFKGPNPFDADELFQKPLSVYLSAANGAEGKTQIAGSALNKEVIQEVSRSTAATGNEASARIIRTNAQQLVTIHLSGDPVKKIYDAAHHDPEQVCNDMTSLYHQIRADD
ncbi:MAG TPA: hypothetical protein VN673_02495 [Clostridia bacterium]|nr:hypothetical protein [Clostridia bacterium]